jgi:hypothetical protein
LISDPDLQHGLSERQRARLHRDPDDVADQRRMIKLLRSDSRRQCVRARITLMKALTLAVEGMWGLVQHQVTPVAFAATWSAHNSYWQYGLDYLSQTRRHLKQQSTIDAAKLVKTCRIWPKD